MDTADDSCRLPENYLNSMSDEMNIIQNIWKSDGEKCIDDGKSRNQRR